MDAEFNVRKFNVREVQLLVVVGLYHFLTNTLFNLDHGICIGNTVDVVQHR